MLWDWDEVFRYLVRKCNQHGGYYELSIDEGAQFKKGRWVKVGENIILGGISSLDIEEFIQIINLELVVTDDTFGASK